MALEARGSAGTDGTALSPVRQSQSVRAAGVLHPARLGVEGQSERDVRELAPAGVVRRVQGAESVNSDAPLQVAQDCVRVLRLDSGKPGAWEVEQGNDDREHEVEQRQAPHVP